MKSFALTKRDFPSPENGSFNVPYSRKALIRGAIAAGRNPDLRRKSPVTRNDIAMRVNGLLSALDMSGNAIQPTNEYLNAGPTEKGLKSFFVGNALCAHTAYSQLGIVWLRDVETLSMAYGVHVPAKSKRPDYIGLTPSGDWYVFESKGRTSFPRSKSIKPWKVQAQSISHVKGRKVARNIVSASYMGRTGKKKGPWCVLWVDPPSDEGVNIDLNEAVFMASYYGELLDFVGTERSFSPIIAATGFVRISGTNTSIGLHNKVKRALLEGDLEAITSFAKTIMDQNKEGVLEDGNITTFADGLIVKIDSDDDRAPRPDQPLTSNLARKVKPRFALPSISDTPEDTISRSSPPGRVLA